MKRQMRTEGSILELHINNEYYVYAQILKDPNYVFFDYRSKEPLKDFTPLETASWLFVVAVYRDVITRGEWLKVGKMEIRDEFKILALRYIKDVIDGSFRLYDTNTGAMWNATKEECRGLEIAAVWDSNHVEDRIRDHYNGIVNEHVAYELKRFDS